MTDLNILLYPVTNLLSAPKGFLNDFFVHLKKSKWGVKLDPLKLNLNI